MLRIGTRGSQLALVQAEYIKRRLLLAWPDRLSEDRIEIVPIKTTGDAIQDRPLSEIGGKGLFTKEIEEALLNQSVDLAVHSLKDMPGEQPRGLVIACVPEREDPRDAFISERYTSLEEMPAGTRVGTSSLRRAAAVAHMHPHLDIVPLRGNVPTRLGKLARGEFDAMVLAVAGLKRLGMEHRITAALDPEIMLPAVAQGALGIEIRESDSSTAELLAPLNHSDSHLCARAERALMRVVGGDCRTPLGGYAMVKGKKLWLRGCFAAGESKKMRFAEAEGEISSPEKLGELVGNKLKK